MDLSVIFYSKCFQIPKLVYQDIIQNSNVFSSGVKHGLGRELFEKHFNICSPENVYRSALNQEKDGAFGFTRLIDLSPAEVSFIANGSLIERLLFSVGRWDRQFLDGLVDLIMESEDDVTESKNLGIEKVRAVTRMLLLPSKSETNVPFETLILSHQHRLASNVRLLHSSFSFIPKARAPPVRFVIRFYIHIFLLFMPM